MRPIFSGLALTPTLWHCEQDELEAELEDLEGAELEEQLIRPSTQPLPEKYQPTPVPAAKKPAQNTEEEDELAALQAEMAL